MISCSDECPQGEAGFLFTEVLVIITSTAFVGFIDGLPSPWTTRVTLNDLLSYPLNLQQWGTPVNTTRLQSVYTYINFLKIIGNYLE